MQKSVAPPTFVAGEIATYTLGAADERVRDRLGHRDHRRPAQWRMSAVWTHRRQRPSGPASRLRCDSVGAPRGPDRWGSGRLHGHPERRTGHSPWRSRRGHGTGRHAPSPRSSYQGRMRTVYSGTGPQSPPVSPGSRRHRGTRTPTVALTGQTTAPPGINAPAPRWAERPETVKDNSSATQSSTQPKIDKRIKPNVSGADGYQCAQGTTKSNPGGAAPGSPVTTMGAAEYVDPATVSPPDVRPDLLPQGFEGLLPAARGVPQPVPDPQPGDHRLPPGWYHLCGGQCRDHGELDADRYSGRLQPGLGR